MEMTTSICRSDSSHSSWTMASSSASVSPLSLPESTSESAVPKEEGYDGGLGMWVFLRQGTDMLVGGAGREMRVNASGDKLSAVSCRAESCEPLFRRKQVGAASVSP